MSFLTGNSGSYLFETVTKVGLECQQEGAFCQLLGETVCPKVIAIIPNGYVMERLEVAPRIPSLLQNIERLLLSYVWNQPASPSSDERIWQEDIDLEYLTIPNWIEPEKYCRVHGDPTASNALQKEGRLILCDPRPPRWYIPQCRETDMGRILQSMFGWEEAAYGAEHVEFHAPYFWYDYDCRRKAIFWMKAAVVRILRQEKNRHEPNAKIINWCLETLKADYKKL